MTDIKRTQPLEQIREVPTARDVKSRDKKEQKHKFISPRPREVFLTDSQTDQTKSSNEANTVETQLLHYNVKKLEKENAELKECILKMKASQFYGINEEKVKNLIKQNQALQNEVKLLRKQLERVLIQKDFLERNNRAFKEKYEQSTKENNKGFLNSRLRTEFSRINQYQLNEGAEQFKKDSKHTLKQKRSTSSQKSKVLKKKPGSMQADTKIKADDKKNKDGIKHHEDYYIINHAKSNRKL